MRFDLIKGGLGLLDQKRKIWEYNDGGRKAAGYAGKTGDCSTRAIAIVTGKSYEEVYRELTERGKADAQRRRRTRLKKQSARTGVSIKVLKEYLATLGYNWI